MSNGIAVSSSSIVDDISQGIGSVDISDNNDSLLAAALSDMSSSRAEDMNSTNDVEVDNTSGSVKSDMLLKGEVNSDIEVEVSTCANCGKEGTNNTCNKCKSAKYCNAACKKRHRHKHKKDCEEHIRRAAKLQEEEIKRVAELHDKELFKQPPQEEEDCPICFQPLPYLCTGKRYNSCCGKMICNGCIHAMDNKLCPFCRTPHPTTDKELVERLMRRVDTSDAEAIQTMGSYYWNGQCGLPQDYTKALDLYHQAAELNNATAYHNIANAYYFGRGAEIDKKKAEHYWELGAMKGCAYARHKLGVFEDNKGNRERALKHYMISVSGGHNGALEQIQKLYSFGLATKDEYSKALQDYQKYLVEVKSTQRDEAAAADEDYKYIA